MSRAALTPAQQEAVDLLTESGFAVLRAASLNRLRERARVAEALHAAEVEHLQRAQAWGERGYQEQQGLRDRIDDLVEFALRHGATIDDLAAFNEHLRQRRQSEQPEQEGRYR